MANYMSNHAVTSLEVSAIRRLYKDQEGDDAKWWRELVIHSNDGDIEITLFADSYGKLIFDFEPEVGDGDA